MPFHVDFNVTDFHLMHRINFKPGCDHIIYILHEKWHFVNLHLQSHTEQIQGMLH